MADEIPNPTTDAAGNASAEQALQAAKEAIAAAQEMNAKPAAEAGASAVKTGTEVMAAMEAAMREDPGTASGRGGGGHKGGAPAVQPVSLPDFGGSSSKSLPAGMELLSDIALNVRIELGRTKMLLEDVLKLGDGTVVELDKLAGDPVDIYVNDRPVARGEVLVLNDNFCIRISEVFSKEMIDQLTDSKPAA
ncbi:MAG: flagellar motor switch protein FliN [bacterium]|jgi:flagellar motor switch protein FliN/FliY|nr:flagellar motor switch protein FliN [Phycisphaeraceae bacterium]